MFKNFLKIAVRNIKRNKGYSFINIAGLATGMACFILMLLLVVDELSYNRSHENAQRIYRVIIKDPKYKLPVAVTEAPLAAALKKDFPEIIESVCFNYAGGGWVKYGDKAFEEGSFTFTDPSFFKMFTFTFLKGSPQTALEDPLGVVLSEKTAEKYFGNKNPLGEVLEIKDITNLTVTGVIRPPKNSSMKVDFIVSNHLYDKYGVDTTRWGYRNYITFVMLQSEADADQLKSQIYGYYKKIWRQTTTRLILQPLERMHLHSIFLYDKFDTSSIYFSYILLSVAVFTLLIACVNFMNLSTARSAKRMKEVGLRKVVGADKQQLIRQFLGESILFAFIALLFAIFLVELALPFLNQMPFRGEMSLYGFLNLPMVLGLIFIALFTGIIAGSYPAFFLSSFRVVNVLKGYNQKGSKGSIMRKILAIGQFTFSILLIIVITVLYKQLHYIRQADLGYEKKQLVTVYMNADNKKVMTLLKTNY